MVNQARFIKTALVFSGTLAVSIGLIALPAFSQTNLQTQLNETNAADPVDSSGLSDLEAIALDAVLDSDKADLETVLSVTASVIEPLVEATAEAITEPTADSEMAMTSVAEALRSDITELQATAPITPSATEVADPPASDEISSATASITPPTTVTETDSAAIAGLLETASLESKLGRIEADSVPALRAALNSDHALTQLYAADTLWTLTSDRDLILPTLISVAAGSNLQTRELATAALGYLGRQALPAVPFLNRLLRENNAQTQAIAQTALEAINSNNRPATTLGILTQASRRQGVLPTVVRALNRLWRLR